MNEYFSYVFTFGVSRNFLNIQPNALYMLCVHQLKCFECLISLCCSFFDYSAHASELWLKFTEISVTDESYHKGGALKESIPILDDTLIESLAKTVHDREFCFRVCNLTGTKWIFHLLKKFLTDCIVELMLLPKTKQRRGLGSIACNLLNRHPELLLPLSDLTVTHTSSNTTQRDDSFHILLIHSRFKTHKS